MAAVDIGIGHNDNLAIAKLFDVEFIADTGPKRP